MIEEIKGRGTLRVPTPNLRPASPCPRPHCGGSILGEDACHLCGRPTYSSPSPLPKP